MTRLTLTCLGLLLPLLLTACSLSPATRDDYERIYYDRCYGGGLDRPPYCDR